MHHPPNIHDAIEGFVLLRQALEILEAQASDQRALYPPERVAPAEMTTLYRDAWSRVRATARAILPAATVMALEAVDEALRAEAVAWDAVRRRARRAGDLLPTPERRHAPRRWDEQLVPGPNHLLHRRQLEEETPAGE